MNYCWKFTYRFRYKKIGESWKCVEVSGTFEALNNALYKLKAKDSNVEYELIKKEVVLL